VLGFSQSGSERCHFSRSDSIRSPRPRQLRHLRARRGPWSSPRYSLLATWPPCSLGRLVSCRPSPACRALAPLERRRVPCHPSPT
jgi:hypothetical protein